MIFLFTAKAKNSSGVVDGYFTQEELDKLEKKITETIEWRDQALKDQEAQPMHEMPKMTTSLIAEKALDMDREVKHMYNKVKIGKAAKDRKKEEEAKKKEKEEKKKKKSDAETPDEGNDFEYYIELVPDLVWIRDPHYQPSSTPPASMIHNDPLLDHPMPPIPISKFLQPLPFPQVSKQEVSVVWTAVIVATIHFMFDFFR